MEGVKVGLPEAGIPYHPGVLLQRDIERGRKIKFQIDISLRGGNKRAKIFEKRAIY